MLETQVSDISLHRKTQAAASLTRARWLEVDPRVATWMHITEIALADLGSSAH